MKGKRYRHDRTRNRVMDTTGITIMIIDCEHRNNNPRLVHISKRLLSMEHGPLGNSYCFIFF